MRRIVVMILVLLLSTGTTSVAKTDKTVKELFKESFFHTINIDKNGHIPYRMQSATAYPWQSGSGTKKVLVLLLEFPDEIHHISRNTLEDYFLSDHLSSVKSYYNEVSNGSLQVDLGKNGVPEWMMFKKSYEQYIKDCDYDYYTVCDAVAKDGLKMLIEKGVDLSEYDTDGNGAPDIITYFCAGDSARVGGYMPGAFTTSNDQSTIVMVSEDISSRSNNTPSIIHEYGHALIPVWDLYDYSYMSDPIQDWDIMDGSAEGRCNMSAYTRWKAGWIDLKWIDQPGEYEIDNLNGKGSNKAFGIKIPGSDQEWLLVENRQKNGLDNIYSGSSGQGIVTYLIDDKRPYAHLFNTLTRKNKTHGVLFLKLLTTDGKLTADTTPSSLPYVKIDRIPPNIAIRNVSKPDEIMKFTLSFDRPKLPVASVSSKIFAGKVVKDTKKTFEIPFVNIGMGTLYVLLSSKEKWLTLDRTSFIGNEETVFGTIDAQGMKLGKAYGTITFNNRSSETGGFVVVEFEVVPIYGDLDANGVVDGKDFEAFMKLYGLKGDDPTFKPEADFNSDGVIDFTDLMMLAKNYKGN